MSPSLTASVLIAAALATFFVLLFLSAMFNREAVKRDLHQRGCRPSRVSWKPLAYWCPSYRATPFQVTYHDPDGLLHSALCCVSTPLMGSPFAGRHVEWIKDEFNNLHPGKPESD